MTKEDWAKAEDLLGRPFGSVTLLADGYEITLQLHMLRNMMHNAIAIFVNGQFKGKWLTEDCEERRRFIPQKEVPLMNRRQVAEFKKLPKSSQKRLKEYREKTITQYATHWTSWAALVRHFEANNQDIQLKEDT